MKALEIVDKVKAALEPELQARGLEIIDAEYKREPIGMVLRLFIDRPAGVDLKVCAEASNVISKILDDSDIIIGSYTLEVSSPGVERRLTKPEHFLRFVGSKAVVKLKVARQGRRQFTGVLSAADPEGFTLETDAGLIDFEYAQLARANLVY